MSGISVNTLFRRSESFRNTAYYRFKHGDYDLVCFDVEQSLQLRVKALLLELFELESRVHGVRSNLSILYKEVKNSSIKPGLLDVLRNFLDKYRDELYFIDTSHSDTRYGFIEYSRKDAIKCLEVMEELIKLLDRVECSFSF